MHSAFFLWVCITSVFLITSINTLQAQFSGGSGTSADPYQISTLDDLQAMDDINYKSNYFILTNDIDASATSNWNSGEGFNPIGYSENAADNQFSFEGSFNGKGHTISNLFINYPSGMGGTGLFVGIYKGKVDSLGLVDVNIYAQHNSVGGITGDLSDGSINCCFVTGELHSDDSNWGYAGGIATTTYSTNTISNCWTMVNLHGDREGGIIGGIGNTTITNCYSASSFSGSATLSGGLMATTYSYNPVFSVSHSYWNKDNISNNYFGGIGLTTDQMQQQASFVDFDFTNVWSIDPNNNGGYPTLKVFSLSPGDVATTICYGSVPTDSLILSVGASGGSGDYGYEWQYSVDNGLNWDVAPGRYDTTFYVPSASLTDTTLFRRKVMDLSCSSEAYSDTFQINVWDSIAIQLNPVMPSCNGSSDGYVTASVSGGNAPYSYLWNNSATIDSIGGISAGTYAITVTDANGCTATTSIEVEQPSALSLTQASQTNVACNGSATGAASVNVATGGTGSYTYNWTPGNPTGDGTPSVTGLSAGTWTCTVTDDNGCTESVNFTITQPTALSLTQASQTNIACNGSATGAASVNVATGGTGSYTYNWTPGNPTGDGTPSVTGLSAGTWTCTVTDANNCTASVNFTITQPTALSLTSASQTNIACNGGATGAASVNAATGGTGNYSYNWTPGNPTGDGTPSVTGLSAGTWTCTVTDDNGCTASVDFTVTEPNELIASGQVISNVSCNGGNNGAATVNVTGGTSPYTYQWDNGATTASISGVTAWTYKVTLTDAKGCTATTSVEVEEPAELSASGVATHVSCNGGNDGAVDLTITGGTAPYSFAWSNTAFTEDLTDLTAGTYDVTVMDVKGCTAMTSVEVEEPAVLSASGFGTDATCAGNDGAVKLTVSGGNPPYMYAWSNSATTKDMSGLAADTYSVTVTDSKGCTVKESVVVGGPPAIIANGIATNASCNGGNNGAVVLTVSGGVKPYTYSWSNGATTKDITGIKAGTYNVTVTDANGCTATESVEVTEPTALIASGQVTSNVSCNGGNDGAATVNVTGGTSPYTYQWDNSAMTASIAGVTAWTYQVTVTDANGCTANASVTITEPTALSANITLDNNLTCSNDNNGGATVEVTGGTAPYTYEWDNQATTASVTNLTLGNHSVTITDSNGCTATQTISIDFDDSTLPVPDVSILPNISEYCEVYKADVPAPTATDNCSGTLTGTTNAIFPITTLGTTTIAWTYEDEKGNKFTQQQNIIVNPSPLSDVSFSDATVAYDGTVHSLAVTGLPAGASVNYQNNGQTDAGSYEVTATLNPGTSRCSSTTLTATLTIEKAEQIIFFDEIPDKNLGTDADFSLTATASSGLPVSYTYSYSADTPPAEVSEAGEVSLLTSGTVEITAHQEGNENYLQATTVTRTLTIESSDATIHELTINGEVYDNPDNNIYYLIDCNNDVQSVEINFSNEANANASESDNFVINTSAPGIYQENIEITSQDGSQTENYTITVEKRFSYEDIIVRKFNNVLLINNNPETNGGYHFESFEWYKDGVLIGTDQYYSAGENSTDQLDLDANYSATMTTEDGDVLQTCDFIISEDNVFTMAVSPNPVSAGSSIDVITNFTTKMLDNMTIRVSRLYGTTVLETVSGTNKSQINLPATMTSGTYIVTSTADGVKLTGKIIVK